MRTKPKPVRLQGDDGSVIAEFALMLPLMITMVMGVFEFGMFFRQQNVLAGSLQMAARTVAKEGRTRTADYQAVLGVKATALAYDNVDLNYMIIYRSTSAGVANPPPSQCIADANALSPTATPAPHGRTAQSCNIYMRSQIAAASQSSTTPGFQNSSLCPTGLTGSWDQFWCPLSRVTTLTGTGTDHIGVYFSATYRAVTNVFGATTKTFTDYTIFKLEA